MFVIQSLGLKGEKITWEEGSTALVKAGLLVLLNGARNSTIKLEAIGIRQRLKRKISAFVRLNFFQFLR